MATDIWVIDVDAYRGFTTELGVDPTGQYSAIAQDCGVIVAQVPAMGQAGFTRPQDAAVALFASVDAYLAQQAPSDAQASTDSQEADDAS